MCLLAVTRVDSEMPTSELPPVHDGPVTCSPPTFTPQGSPNCRTALHAASNSTSGHWLSNIITRKSSQELYPSSFSQMPDIDTPDRQSSPLSSASHLLPLGIDRSPRALVYSNSMRKHSTLRAAVRAGPVITREETLGANDMGGKLAPDNALCRDLDFFNQLGVCMGVIQYVSAAALYQFQLGASLTCRAVRCQQAPQVQCSKHADVNAHAGVVCVHFQFSLDTMSMTHNLALLPTCASAARMSDPIPVPALSILDSMVIIAHTHAQASADAHAMPPSLCTSYCDPSCLVAVVVSREATAVSVFALAAAWEWLHPTATVPLAHHVLSPTLYCDSHRGMGAWTTLYSQLVNSASLNEIGLHELLSAVSGHTILWQACDRLM